eukprot:TRINITY_DN27939_c0_g1_i1.p1 TRINITY_DN27939_c0_g1~~TRINITY_DN27939_c0_g1_i1.p1  ORF type:complete len:306 (+),score=71.72 TRINITY_DN27939_c0_g1_i1:60-977(+)
MAVRRVMVDTPAVAKRVVGQYDTFVFDCDGVIWGGADALPGVSDAVAHLQGLGKQIFFVSNNSTKDRATYVEKFHNVVGAKWVEAGHVFHSGYATAEYLVQQGMKGERVYVVGEAGLKREIEAVGCTVVTDDDNGWAKLNPDIEAARPAEPVAAVVVGNDFHWCATKLARAAAYLTAEGSRAQFVLTNPDIFNVVNGRRIPEAGSIAAAITSIIGRPPDVVCGKPSPMLFEILAAAHPSIDRASTVMVGDRLDTDIRFGASVGIDQLMVLTGAHSLEDVDACDEAAHPTYIAPGVAELVALAREA